MSLWRGCHSAASARGAVWWGDVLFLVTSLAYVLMDFLPPVPHFPAVLLALALAVLASAACYAFAWRGAAPSATEAVAEVRPRCPIAIVEINQLKGGSLHKTLAGPP